MPKTKVAVIGGAGHLGTYLVRRLALEDSYAPVVIIRDAMAGRFLGSDRRYVRLGSITDNMSAKSLLGDCDAVVNLAYAGSTPLAIENNLKLVQAIASIRTAEIVINISTVAVHASPFFADRMEFDRPKPNSAYGVSKLAAERIMSLALKGSESRFYLLRLGYVYGPGQNASQEVFRDIGTPNFSLPFDGQLASNAISINRFTDGIISLLSDPPENGVYNFLDEPQSSWREIYDLHTKAWYLPAVPSMSRKDSISLRLAYRNKAGFDSRPLSNQIKRFLRHVISNPVTNNGLSKRTYLRFRKHVPANIDKAIAGVFGKTLAEMIAATVAESEPLRPRPSSLLIGDPIPGRNVPETAFKHTAERDLSDALLGWYQDLTQFSWNTNSLRK